MPLYTISTQEGVLSSEQKETFARQLTDFHCQMAGVGKPFVKIVFNTFAAGNGFVAGEPAAACILTVLVRAGRSDDYKKDMLLKLWAMLQQATGATNEQMLVAIQEAPASQAMEMGQIMPDLPAP
jgi:phenylpyruvate tautomerase PptA (4-oxalocrotonate tautomerase family)